LFDDSLIFATLDNIENSKAIHLLQKKLSD